MVIADILSHIVSSTWNNGIFSDKLKYPQTKPVWDKVKNKPKKYRLISLLPTFLEVFEKVVHDRLVSFLDILCVLFKNQCGFRKNTYFDIGCNPWIYRPLTNRTRQYDAGKTFRTWARLSTRSNMIFYKYYL